ncbi:MAG: hypothetical protein ACRECP_08435 [Methylocella sp.]
MHVLFEGTCGFGVAARGMVCAAAAPAKTHDPAKITNAPLSFWIFARLMPGSGNVRRFDFKNTVKYDPGHKPPAPRASGRQPIFVAVDQLA